MDEYIFATDFYHKFTKLTEKDRNNFARLSNKLIALNYLTANKESDIEDYYFIIGNFDLFKNFYKLMDSELVQYPGNKVIALYNNSSFSHLHLRLNESIVLLLLRLLYDEKMREVSLIDKIIVSLEDIHDKFLSTGLKDRRISKTEMKLILQLFKRYNLVEIIDYDFRHDDSRVVLYPTILYAVNIDNITKVFEKIQSYKGKGESVEES